jgi:glutaconate CoA-transferase subunit B
VPVFRGFTRCPGRWRASRGFCTTVVITDLGILRPDPESKELTLTGLHPGAGVEEAKEATGWDLRVAEDLKTTDPPKREELRILRALRARTEAVRKGANV